MRKLNTSQYTLIAFLIFITVALRLFDINSPLWLDEFYGYRLVKLGVPAIIQNSWTDPHPPLFYLMQWATLAFIDVQSEIDLRWMSLVSSTLTVFTLGLIIERLTDFFSAAVITLFVATMPSLVFYSQEARPMAFLILVAALSMWLTITIVRNPRDRRLWSAWVIATVLGLYTGYAYLMVAGIQVVYLGYFHYRQIEWWTASGLVFVGQLILLPFMMSSLGAVATKHADTNPLTIWRTLQTMFAGEPLRYGLSLSHTLLPWIVVGLSVVVIIRVLQNRDNILLYFLLQALLPVAAFFVLSPLVNIRLPLPEAKQFLVLIPAYIVIMGLGIAELRQLAGQRGGQLLAISLVGFTVFLNSLSLQAYWTYPKSPEGLAVLALRENLQPGEEVVSFHYSLNYALWFYVADTPLYLNPVEDNGRYQYRLIDTHQFYNLTALPQNLQEAEEIRANGQFWVLAHTSVYRQAMPALIADCSIVTQETFTARNNSFDMMKVQCPS